MPIDEKLLTPEVLNNTLRREVIPGVRIVPGTTPKMGKVRTVYDLGERLLMVSSDNLSTHDVVHPRQVYAKGANLDAISAHYFKLIEGIVPHHLLEVVAPNAWIVRKAQPILVEMVFRQYLTGSGWKAYKAEDGPKNGMTFCGVPLRAGYRENERLDHLIFTPTAKGQVKDFTIPEFTGLDPEEDDPKLTAEVIRRNYKAFGLKKPEDLDVLVEVARRAYAAINADLSSKGWLMADTKWEFGYNPETGGIMMMDECVTPDSSRFWDAAQYALDAVSGKFTVVQGDKQHFRNYVERLGLHKDKAALAQHWMDDAVLREGVVKYCNMREVITGTLPEVTVVPVRQSLAEALAARGLLDEKYERR